MYALAASSLWSSHLDGVRRELVLVPRFDYVRLQGAFECVAAFALFGIFVVVVLAPDTGEVDGG